MTKEKILTAAKELFEDNGFDFTTVRDIAQKADVNIALINYHFGSKEALLESIIETYSNETYLKLKSITKSSDDPVKKMESAINVMLDKIFGQRKFHQMLYHELSTTQRPETNEKIVKVIRRNRQELRQIIEDGQKKKVFRQDLDVELTLGTLFGLFHQVTNTGHKFMLKETDDKLINRLRQHSLQIVEQFLKKK
jgi:TetR/AcrR family transcriptional regulator, fatty acid metabolism regulator protein